MNKKTGTSKDSADKLVRGIKRKTRKHYSSEEKIRVVLAGLRGEESIAGCCQTDSNQSLQGQDPCPLCRAKLAPLSESDCTVLLVDGPGGEAALRIEMVMNRGVDGDEHL